MEKTERMLNAREFAKATGKSIVTIRHNFTNIPGHKKINGRWYFPESSVSWRKGYKVGAPLGKKNKFIYGGKPKKGAKKILWASSLDMPEALKNKIQKTFGENAILMESIRQASDAEQILREFKRGYFDEVIINAPFSVLCRVIELGVNPFWPAVKTVKNHAEADWSDGENHFKFIGFKKIKNFKMVFEKS